MEFFRQFILSFNACAPSVPPWNESLTIFWIADVVEFENSFLRGGKRISNHLLLKIFILVPLSFAFKISVARAEAVDLAYEVRSTMGELSNQKKPSLFTIGLKSQNGLGSLSQMGSYLRSKEEVYFGVRTKTGWGFLVSDGYTYSNHHHSHDSAPGSAGPVEQDTQQPGRKSARGKNPNAKLNANSDNSNQSVDESLSLVEQANPTGLSDLSALFFHPIVRDEDQNFSGMFRTSIPTTERSESTNSVSLGYNLIYSLKLQRQWNFSTVWSLTYFSRSNYTAPMDSIYGTGLINSLNRRMNSWLRLGSGQRSSLMTHTTRAPGVSTEIFTTADFLITPSIFLGPRIHFPVYSEGASFSDVPTNPAIQNISADFFMQVSI